MESVQWLLLNADKISVVSLLAVFSLAMVRQWIVPGSMYRKCLAKQDVFEKKVEDAAKSNEDKLALVTSELALLRDEFRRRR